MFTLMRSARCPSCCTSSGEVPGTALRVDVAAESPLLFTQEAESVLDHELGGAVGGTDDAGS